MGGLLNFFESIWGTVTALIAFVVHGIESLIKLLINLPLYIETLTTAIAYIPAVYQGVILATIGISVIFLITARGK